MADIDNIETIQDLKDVVAQYLVTPASPKLKGSDLGKIIAKHIELGGNSTSIVVRFSDMTLEGTRLLNIALAGLDFVMTLNNGIRLYRNTDYALLVAGGFDFVHTGRCPQIFEGDIIHLSNFTEATVLETPLPPYQEATDEEGGIFTFTETL